MGAFDWESFLRQWSQDVLASISDDERQHLSPGVLSSGWLGYPGATEEEIARAEARLKVKLPPSYRAFLKVTNGWRQTASKTANYNHRFWSTEDIEQFSVRHPQWIRAFADRIETVDPTLEDEFQELNDHWEPVGVTDDEYFVYGEKQDPSNLRPEYLKTAIEISDVGFDSIYLLNPQVVTSEGEWEAWFFADYLPGADRYRSFQEMMEAEYRNFLEMREDAEGEQSAIALSSQTKHELALADKSEQSAIELTEAAFETKIYPPLAYSAQTDPITWQSLNQLSIELQGRVINDQVEYRTIARSRDLPQSQTWPGLAEHQLQKWLRRALMQTQSEPLEKQSESSPLPTSATLNQTALSPPVNSVSNNPAVNVRDESEQNLALSPVLKVDLDVEQLAIHQATCTDTVIVVRPAEYAPARNSVLGALNSQHPFSIEVAFHLAVTRNNHPDLSEIFYKTQVFAQNRTSHEWIELGESPLNSLNRDRASYTASLFNQKLSSGLYRLQIITSLSGAAKALSSFELPLLNVT